MITAGPIFVFGAGRVGLALSRLLTDAGVPIVGLWTRSAERAARATTSTGLTCQHGALPKSLANARTVLLAVRDTAIPAMAEALGADGLLSGVSVVLQCSGAQAARTMFKGLGDAPPCLGTFHPLVAVTEAEQATEALRGSWVSLEGDPGAVAEGRAIAHAMGVRTVELSSEAMALYHAAAVIASNHAVALWYVAQQLLGKAGVTAAEAQAMLVPLLQSTVGNVISLGLPDALTGPARRGDLPTIQRHLDALQDEAPELLNLYCVASRAALDAATECDGPPSAEELRAIREMLTRVFPPKTA